jgi:phage shock protein E
MRRLIATLGLMFSLPLMAGEAELQAAVTALQSPDTLLIDVRTVEEYDAGALPNAERIGHEQIASQISALAPDKDTPIVLYCRSGRRSEIAEQSLRAMGYTHLINAGGYDELKLALESQD